MYNHLLRENKAPEEQNVAHFKTVLYLKTYLSLTRKQIHLILHKPTQFISFLQIFLLSSDFNINSTALVRSKDLDL